MDKQTTDIIDQLAKVQLVYHIGLVNALISKGLLTSNDVLDGIRTIKDVIGEEGELFQAVMQTTEDALSNPQGNDSSQDLRDLFRVIQGGKSEKPDESGSPDKD